jgi:SAM-dependent methyltransferase
MSVTTRYRNVWEGFWQEAPNEPGAVLWDSTAELTARGHLALFDPYVADRTLPLVDLGCGNGTQTVFLARHFDRVIGADLSAAAVMQARHQDVAHRVEFRELDAADPDGVRGLAAELGDVNVYMRGVLHQSDPDDRQPLADGVAALLGTHGRAFVVELSASARPVLLGFAGETGGSLPKLRPVLAHGIAPGDVPDAEIPAHFRAAGLEVLASGTLPLATTEHGGDGSRIDLPSMWMVLGVGAGR